MLKLYVQIIVSYLERLISFFTLLVLLNMADPLGILFYNVFTSRLELDIFHYAWSSVTSEPPTSATVYL